MRIYAYVDCESHYVRSFSFWKRLHGEEADLSHLEQTVSEHEPIRHHLASKFFWDPYYRNMPPSPFDQHHIARFIYFTSISGSDDEYHQACLAIRKHGFDPQVVHEVKLLANHRKNYAASGGVIEKAKAVDIGLSIRILEDAYHNNFDTCFLFTSDIDFLPVIQVIRKLGKNAVVFGYKAGLGDRSKLEYVPDAFVELSHRMTTYRYTGPTEV